MSKLTVYYAHPVSLYDTEQEKRDIQTLEGFGFEVCNPNCTACAELYKEAGMDGFQQIVATKDALAFRAFPDGAIPAGVLKEIMFAREAGKPVIELPSAVLRRGLTKQQTREALLEGGER
jgi:hypothetical protein